MDSRISEHDVGTWYCIRYNGLQLENAILGMNTSPKVTLKCKIQKSVDRRNQENDSCKL